MDALVDILLKFGLDAIKKWVDDLLSFRFPNGRDANGQWTYPYDIEDIFRITEALGVPWKLGKCFRYAFLVVYLGFLWNLHERCVSLPVAKRAKYIEKLETFYQRALSGRVALRETMSIAGTLSHIAFVYTAGRSYLTGLSHFIASFPHPHALRYPSKSLLSDLRWWRDVLRQPNFTRSLVPRSAQCDPGVWVDASTSWGIGVLIGGKWAAWKLVDGWKANSRDIGWAEMIALELACLYLETMQYTNVDILIHSDNVGVIGAFLRGRSRNFQVNLAIRRTMLICMARNFALFPEYVNTEYNLADPVSRGILGNDVDRLPVLPALPMELHPFLENV